MVVEGFADPLLLLLLLLLPLPPLPRLKHEFVSLLCVDLDWPELGVRLHDGLSDLRAKR